MTTYTPRAQRGRKSHNRRRIFLALGLVLTALVVWGSVRFYQFWTKPLAGSAVEGESAVVPLDKNHFTILLVGADQRPDDIGRSDTMLLAFVDLEKGAVKLLSFPRDSYAEIPGNGWDKINASYSLGGTKLVKQTFDGLDGVPVEKLNATYASGGAKLVKKTVENLTGVTVDYWVTVDMSGFAGIVDSVGGIDVVIDNDLDYEDPWDTPPLFIHLKAGAQRLEGTDALHYVRFRHDAQSDWGRMARQQQAIKALVKAAMRPSNLTQIPQLLKLGMANVHTNMTPSQVYDLADVGKKMLTADSISSVSLTGEDLWAPVNSKDPNTTEVYYTVLDFAKMRQTVREMAGLVGDQKVLDRDRTDAVAYEKAIPFGSVDSGGWYRTLFGSDVAADDKTPPKKDDKTPPGNGGKTPPGNGGKTPPGNGGKTPPGNGGKTPPGNGGKTPPGNGGTPPPGDGGTPPPGDGGTPPPGNGGTTPPADDGTTPPADGGTTPPADGGTTPPADGGKGAG